MSPPHIPANPAPDWQAVAQDYGNGILSVVEICTLHGISPKRLYRRINAEGWPRRRRPSNFTTSQALASTADMPNRLLRALDLKMTELENRMIAGTELPTAADCERNVRTLNTLVGLFEKLKKQAASDGAMQTKAAMHMDGDQPGLPDADMLRRQLAERLNRLGRAQSLMAEDSQGGNK